MPASIRITYRHVLGCLVGDCPSHAATIRTSADVDSVLRALTEQHADFPIDIEGIEEVQLTEVRPRRRAATGASGAGEDPRGITR